MCASFFVKMGDSDWRVEGFVGGFWEGTWGGGVRDGDGAGWEGGREVSKMVR